MQDSIQYKFTNYLEEKKLSVHAPSQNMLILPTPPPPPPPCLRLYAHVFFSSSDCSVQLHYRKIGKKQQQQAWVS